MPESPFVPLAPAAPIVVAPAPKTYEKLWLVEFSLVSPAFDSARVIARLRPFNSSTGEMAPAELDQVVRIEEAMLVAAQVPEMLAAVNAILTGIAAWQAWQAAQAAPETPPA
jgi:hypothetical protein